MRYCKTPPRSIPVSSPMSGATTGFNLLSVLKANTASVRFNWSWPQSVPSAQPAPLITRDCRRFVWTVIVTKSMHYRDQARYPASRRVTSVPVVCAKPVIPRWVLTSSLLSTIRKCLATAASAITTCWPSVNQIFIYRPAPSATTATLPPVFSIWGQAAALIIRELQVDAQVVTMALPP